MTEAKRVRRRIPLLSPRQIGVVVALGGLGFAWIALGLTIPLYILPIPAIIDIREPLMVVVGLSCGPWAGLAAGFLMGIGSYVPALDTPYYMMLGFFTGAVSKWVWRRGGTKRYIAMAAAVFLIEFLICLPYAALLVQAFYGMGIPFQRLLAFAFTFFMHILLHTNTGPVYYIEQVGLAAFCYRVAPKFMKPRWLWSGGEAIEVEETEE